RDASRREDGRAHPVRQVARGRTGGAVHGAPRRTPPLRRHRDGAALLSGSVPAGVSVQDAAALVGPWAAALGFGPPWALGLGPWALGLGPWAALGFGLLGLGPWAALGLGLWALGFGPSALGLALDS